MTREEPIEVDEERVALSRLANQLVAAVAAQRVAHSRYHAARSDLDAAIRVADHASRAFEERLTAARTVKR